jgi:tyrosyl-tRNA synthetase
LLNSQGQKIGKTEKGTNVWLSAERTSPYLLYQYWINLPDADTGMCLRYLTELGREEIEALDVSRAEEPHRRESQRRLAEEITRLVHGDGGLEAAQRATQVFFGAEIQEMDDRQLLEIFADVPSQRLPLDVLRGDGQGILEALVQAGLASTNGEARRLIKQGGAYVNNRRISDAEYRLTSNHLVGESLIVLRSGKKRYALLQFGE